MQKELKTYADLVARVTKSTSGTTNGEVIEFDAKQVTKIVLEGSGLDKLATDSEPARMSQAIDGSRFSPNLHFVMYGIKINDPRGMDPWTKQPLINLAPGGKSTLQSRNNQVPLKIIIAREKEAIYQEFAGFFADFQAMDTILFNEEEELLIPVDMKSSCDEVSKRKRVHFSFSATAFVTNPLSVRHRNN